MVLRIVISIHSLRYFQTAILPRPLPTNCQYAFSVRRCVICAHNSPNYTPTIAPTYAPRGFYQSYALRAIPRYSVILTFYFFFSNALRAGFINISARFVALLYAPTYSARLVVREVFLRRDTLYKVFPFSCQI